MPEPDKPYLRLCRYSDLGSHARYSITLRSSGSDPKYHSLLLFKLARDDRVSDSKSPQSSQMYVMEAACPHLGADLSHAEIEDLEGPDDGQVHELDAVIVCPWHRYDFNLRTGESETGLRACTYGLDIRGSNERESEIWVESPDSRISWEIVNLSPVSEDFADSTFNSAAPTLSTSNISDEEVVPPDNPPKCLVEWAALILDTGDPWLKVARTRHAFKEFSTGNLSTLGRTANVVLPHQPPRPNLINVDPSKAGKRGKAGSVKNRVAMLHALANIEQWAIDLAWDIIARFANTPHLPHQFFTDFAKMALDESKHFTLLSARVSELGSFYGALPIHSALWESALKTAHSLRSRLAIIHLVHEARGLDVNPATIEKFQRAGDIESVKVLEIVHADEVTHVTTGHRWFTWLCGQEEEGSPWRDPVKSFREEVKTHFSGGLKGPFNVADRQKAGLTKEFYEKEMEAEAKGSDVRIEYTT